MWGNRARLARLRRLSLHPRQPHRAPSKESWQRSVAMQAGDSALDLSRNDGILVMRSPQSAGSSGEAARRQCSYISKVATTADSTGAGAVVVANAVDAQQIVMTIPASDAAVECAASLARSSISDAAASTFAGVSFCSSQCICGGGARPCAAAHTCMRFECADIAHMHALSIWASSGSQSDATACAASSSAVAPRLQL